jgi:ABC-type nickel/cobalt efflux system permease component RcnA
MMKLLLLIVIAIGVTLIYDARKITTKYFSNQDKNKTAMLLKLVGFLFCVISGTAMVFLNV